MSQTAHAPIRKALILAAGEGTRLRPLTLDRPKPMLPVAGKPVLEHIVNWLRHHGIDQIAINLHYLPATVMQHFGDGRRWQVSITYSVEERILGTAGGAKRLQSFLEEPFIVAYGDVLTDLDLRTLATRHVSNPARPAVTMALYRVPNPWECGIVTIDAANRVLRFVEKPPREAPLGDLANSGVLVVEPAVLDLIPPGRQSDFGKDVFPLLLAREIPVFGWPIGPNDYLLDMGSVEKHRQAEEDAQRGRWRPCPGPAGNDAEF